MATSSFDINLFIKSIENRPCIWNRSQYLKSVSDIAWEELSEMFKQPTNILKRKWKGLRDNFREQLKRIPKGGRPQDYVSEWMYFEPLLFLVGQIRSRRANNKPIDESINETFEFPVSEHDVYEPVSEPVNELVEEPAFEYFVFEPEYEPVNETKVSIRYEPDCESIDETKGEQVRESVHERLNGRIAYVGEELKAVESRVMDDDHYFLLSLHPYIKGLSATEKLGLRIEILKLVSNKK